MSITGGQLFWITNMFDLGMAAFLMVSPTVQRVKNDAWISLIISGLLSMLATWISIRLSRYHPDKPFIDYVNDIVGPWFGKFIGVIYVVNWIFVTGMVLRQITDILVTSQFHRTPTYLFIISMSLIAIYALHNNGIQSLGRVTEVIGPLVLVIAMITFALDLSNMDWKRLLPIYVTSGPHLLFYGAIPAASFMAQSSYVHMILHFVKDPRKSGNQAIWGTGLASVFLVLSGIFTVGTFGTDLCTKMWNPVLSMAQYISVAEIIQNTDAIILVIWFLTAFIRIGFFLFLSIYGTSRVLGRQNWKASTAWVTITCIIIALLPRNMIESSVTYPQKVVEPFVLPVLLFAVPLVLWFIAFLRLRLGRHANQN
jgi:spore germination protein KB